MSVQSSPSQSLPALPDSFAFQLTLRLHLNNVNEKRRASNYLPKQTLFI